MERIAVETTAREQMHDITGAVRAALRTIGAVDGICLVASSHTTAGITVNENADPGVIIDLLNAFRRLGPRHADYRHIEDNSDAHIKTSLVGVSVSLPVAAGRLVLGRWQSVFFCEFDGPRRREITVTFVGSTAGGS